ncbi:MAG: 1-aminocyclopropane-1-carboxylate deaminase/D-cysteine desulfhydrase [Cyclobacteriaceae bacterium]|nr:1-aminocyclopropane-1-carboxylate deaminase/D-cysteine desulfhydrase [Cyclobacteriaceae bacterium]
MFDEFISTPIVQIFDADLKKNKVELFIKREDLTDPFISGNKYRKLKYNLINAKENGFETLLTFGGAYSNHIHAVAYAGFKFGFKTIGIIRGEETKPLNPTLEDAASFGMNFHYVSRAEYRRKNEHDFISWLKMEFGNFYLIPEGGSNALAVKGCTEILSGVSHHFDHICCACGTGGTIAGIISGLNGNHRIWGYPALKKGEFLKIDISNLIYDYNSKSYENWDLITEYHFGGYAKYSFELIKFINRFKKMHNIQLDPIYTGKLLFGIYDRINTGFYKHGEKILAIHTGGLQGIRGFNERFGNLIN